MKKGRGITRWIAVMVAVFIAVLTVVPAGFSFFGTETYAEIKKEEGFPRKSLFVRRA